MGGADIFRWAGAVVGIAVPLAVAAWRKWKVRHRNSWPTAFGTIEYLSVAYDENKKGYTATLSYPFEASGEFYAGFYERTFKREKKAESFINQRQRGEKVMVRYDPRDPQVSTLDDTFIQQMQTAMS